MLRTRFATLLLTLLAGPALAQEQPSFLVIVADDLGRDAVGFTGDHPTPPSTPFLDQLAAGGVQFRRAYSTAMCSPTRGMLLTGQLPWRTGLGVNIKYDHQWGGLSFNLPTIPKILGPAWRRVALGKWHVSDQSQVPSDPSEALGFDSFRGSWFNLNPFGQSYFRWWMFDEDQEDANFIYATTSMVDEAVHEFRTGTQPLFLYLALHAPHSPFHVPPAHLANTPADDSTPALYHAMVEAMDTEIGRLLNELDASSYADNTWVIFLGDNGTPEGAVLPPWRPGQVKGSVYEGGIRVPLIVRGPATAPGEVQAPVQLTDIFATVAELAGVPGDAPDSISLVPYLQGDLTPLRDHAYTENFGPNGFIVPKAGWVRAVVGQRFKLVESKNSGNRMFDLLMDPGETRNIIPNGPGGLKGDARRAYAWLRERIDVQGGGIYD